MNILSYAYVLLIMTAFAVGSSSGELVNLAFVDACSLLDLVDPRVYYDNARLYDVDAWSLLDLYYFVLVAFVVWGLGLVLRIHSFPDAMG